mmetsp:Transcript_21568/g.38258  ORF Transcript_21568/g.38258 Transcript_21568/m.38258 type:complete len:239 (-) Transcript_21568:141-857(-)|eukprot:CAMPEP_0197532602 /NCGR_PEP_ID=MMETSP1318-20131121/40335_1 /TAXON_ID=552666 /ORGANISM="Partenskyella glossopodia, Strain RCC365" /LENGTH=238 /DNA_ID=CAMNT_0043089223 /DNA_START=53 /DNA_END=769 /DNA_ORIENTATION=+
MSNIHGLGSYRSGKDESKDTEEFSGGGKSSHTAVVRKAQRNPNNATVIVSLYNNGFMVSGDEKGFRDSSNPTNKQIIDELKKTKQVPKELEAIISTVLKGNAGQQVSVDVKDKSGETYYPPKETFKAFQGQGFSIKSEAKTTSSVTSVEGKPPKPIQVDSNQPSTRILLQLHPRKRVPTTFNLSHSAMDIYQHVLSLTPPDFGPFDLVSGFPPKSILNEPNKSIEQLKLKGASITQKK